MVVTLCSSACAIHNLSSSSQDSMRLASL